MSMILIGLAVAAALAYLLYRYFPAETRRWLSRIMQARRIGSTLFVLLFATFALASGYPPLMLIGFAIWLGAFLILLFDYSVADIRGWIGV